MNENTTILLVDDNADNIFALEKLLEKPGRAFITTSSGNEGLKIALSQDIDLIILDVQMPEMDGFEMAAILKSKKKTKDIPLIFASAEKKDRHFVMKGFEEGAIDYLSKPLDPELTRAKVAVLLTVQMQKKELIAKNASLQQAEEQIKKLNGDLQKNLAALESTNKELESFSYSVSHDLRAPLRSLLGYSKMLEEDYINKLDDGAKKLLGTIQQSARRMDRLIEDLLAFSKMGKKEIQKNEINVEKQVTKIIEEQRLISPFKAEISLQPLLSISADYALLSQVWINLISNAIKYSSKKENPVIEIGSFKKEEEIIYYIKDNGAGFSMDYAYKLFDVFQRLHKPADFDGTGVGLAIVQRIILRHGGRVWAESQVNEGATFYFSLPIGNEPPSSSESTRA